MRRALRPSRADAVGLAAVGAWLAWVFASAALNGRPAPVASAFVVGPLVVVLGIALGRLAGSVPRGDEPPARPWPRPLAWLRAGGRWVDAVVLLLVVLLLPGTPLRLAPGPAPLGYENANTAAATQLLALCGLLLLDDTIGRPRRVLLGLGALTAAAAGVLHGSVAGIALLAPVAAAVAVSAVRRFRRVWWALAFALAGLAASVSALLWLATRAVWPDAALRGFSHVRQVLWSRAWELWAAHPSAGAGPGAFVSVNPYAPDTDLLTAHSSLLQTLAELGGVGAALLGLLVFSGFAVAASGDRARGVLAVAAWAALWVHSLVDHLFTSPGLALLAGMALGLASSSAWGARAGRSQS